MQIVLTPKTERQKEIIRNIENILRTSTMTAAVWESMELAYSIKETQLLTKRINK